MDESKFLMKNELVQHIEAQLGWGSGIHWTNKEFEELSERIFDSTRKQVSVTTLKRIWGRAEQISNPSVVTLNILAEFAEYKSWRHFLEANKPPSSKKNTTNFGNIGRRLVGLFFFVALSGGIWYSFYGKIPNPSSYRTDISADSIGFSFHKVAIGYPNTVIFKYDVGNVSYDSLFIQQDWDKNKRIPLTEPRGLVTSTYYYPGYYLAKLVVNDQVMKEKNLYIPTNGWQSYIPLTWNEVNYLKPEQVLLDTTLRTTSEVLDQMNDLSLYAMCLVNLTNDPQISSSDFSLETEFRLTQPTQKSICQRISLTVTGTRDVMSIQFSIPGCVGDLMLYLNREMVSGRSHDLSAFGLNLQDWIKCKLEVNDNILVISINNNPIFKQQLTTDLGEIGGVQWAFEGLGEIRRLQMKDKDRKVDLLNE